MKINLDAPGEEARIEIVPLIDVIFCILTFFLLAAVGLSRQSAIGVDLPQAATGTPQTRQMLIVSIDTIGQVYVEQQPVTQAQLQQIILNYRQASPDGMLVLYASRDARYNAVVEVIDLLRSVGGDRVALATLPETNDPNQPQIPGLAPGVDPAAPTDPFGAPGSLPPATSDPLNPGTDLFPGLDSLPSPQNTTPGTNLPGTVTPAPSPTP